LTGNRRVVNIPCGESGWVSIGALCSRRRGTCVSAPLHRRVLILEDRVKIRKLLDALSAPEAEIASSGRQRLAKISREHFDSVVLDLRYSREAKEHSRSGTQEIHPKLIGRVLVIAGHVSDRRIIELLEGKSELS